MISPGRVFAAAALCSSTLLAMSSTAAAAAGSAAASFVKIADFTAATTRVDDWVEQSDTVRRVGMSKATLVLQQTQEFQRAVLFTLLNPQPNGAGFAGVRTFTHLDLTNRTAIALSCRAQGQNFDYKMVLRHRGLNDEPNPTYEQTFKVQAADKFVVVSLPLKDFLPYYRGQQVKDIPLDVTNITSVGLQVAGGVYLPTKQAGVSSLEIDYIRAE